MQAFLDAFAETIANDEHVALVLDGAGWHSSKALRVPANITLVPLPPYSPELNPVERVWLHLKARFLSLRLLNDYKAIVDAACNAWNRLTTEVDASSRSAPTRGSQRSKLKIGGISWSGSANSGLGHRLSRRPFGATTRPKHVNFRSAFHRHHNCTI